jgi:hypothetical protein
MSDDDDDVEETGVVGDDIAELLGKDMKLQRR